MEASEMPAVLTIGHSSGTWKDFLELLRAHRVKRVIDVRSIPRSRHNPQFNREILSTKLRAARIGYVHLRKLGGLRHARRDSPNMGWRNASFRGFADYMQTPEFDAGLHRLMKLAGQKRSAIMCAEAVPWRCHRSLIADALTVRGIRVDDIMSMKRSQVHSLISFARAQGHRITYPVGNAAASEARQTAKASRRNPADLAGACSDGEFVVSSAGEAYGTQARGLNRKSRLKVLSRSKRA